MFDLTWLRRSFQRWLRTPICESNWGGSSPFFLGFSKGATNFLSKKSLPYILGVLLPLLSMSWLFKQRRFDCSEIKGAFCDCLIACWLTWSKSCCVHDKSSSIPYWNKTWDYSIEGGDLIQSNKKNMEKFWVVIFPKMETYALKNNPDKKHQDTPQYFKTRAHS